MHLDFEEVRGKLTKHICFTRERASHIQNGIENPERTDLVKINYNQ